MRFESEQSHLSERLNYLALFFLTVAVLLAAVLLMKNLWFQEPSPLHIEPCDPTHGRACFSKSL